MYGCRPQRKVRIIFEGGDWFRHQVYEEHVSSLRHLVCDLKFSFRTPGVGNKPRIKEIKEVDNYLHYGRSG